MSSSDISDILDPTCPLSRNPSPIRTTETLQKAGGVTSCCRHLAGPRCNVPTLVSQTVAQVGELLEALCSPCLCPHKPDDKSKAGISDAPIMFTGNACNQKVSRTGPLALLFDKAERNSTKHICWQVIGGKIDCVADQRHSRSVARFCTTLHAPTCTVSPRIHQG